MKKELFSGIKIFFICIILLGLSPQLSDAVLTEHPRRIVVFKKSFLKEANQDTLLKNFGAVKIKRLNMINSTVAHLSPQAEKALRRKHEILRIDEDIVISALVKKDKGKHKPYQPPEKLPWGIQRISANLAWPVTTGSAIRVAILDTGIDLNHPDLQDNVKGYINLIRPHKSGNDNNGHGTHVAGIVAAVDNDIGVIGTGPDISLYAVKILNKKGIGWLSDLIDALSWCINNNMQVINMSFGSPDDNQSFYEAIIKVNQAGIVQVASAGNEGEVDGEIMYPAKYPETIAVSAIDRHSNFASFSSYGPEIDLAAPGVNIKSTYKKHSYKKLDGTSMSAAHVTGTVALILTTYPTWGYDTDGNVIWDPQEIKIKLKETAENLGLDSNQQGAGLVRADSAVY